MKVIVKAKDKWSMFHRDVAVSAVQYAIDWYALDGMKIVLRLCGSTEDDGMMAAMDDGRFIVWVSNHNFTLRKILETIFHEMTHVNQSVGGWYLHDDEPKAFWHGRTRDYDQEDDNEYWNAPWEVEARKMGKVMRKAYMKEMK